MAFSAHEDLLAIAALTGADTTPYGGNTALQMTDRQLCRAGICIQSERQMRQAEQKVKQREKPTR